MLGEIKQPMYVFLDEAGDLGFTPKGSKYFIITSITKLRARFLDGPLAALKYDLIEESNDLEYFHAANDRQYVRDRVFELISKSLVDFRIDALVVEKAKTHPLIQSEEKFFPRMLEYLLKYQLHPTNLKGVSQVIVTTDSLPVRSKRSAMVKAIKLGMASHLPKDVPYQIFHHASKSSAGLQVADYCNWAIFRKWERNDKRSYDLIKPSLKSEFDIFGKGTHFFY